MNNAYDKNFYTVINSEGIKSARQVVPFIMNVLKPQTLLDVGTGSGSWARVAQDLGVKVLGIDGAYVPIEQRVLSGDSYLERDLTGNWVSDKWLASKFDVTLCLEVAEHIPYSNSENFISQLVLTSDFVVFSAAIPYQDGTKHVNENWIKYWDNHFHKFNFQRLDIFRSHFWDNSEISFWYRQNLYLYCSAERAAEFRYLEHVLPDDIVHPNLYLWSIERAPIRGLYNSNVRYRENLARVPLGQMPDELLHYGENWKQLGFKKRVGKFFSRKK
jgi:hypothetical protein